MANTDEAVVEGTRSTPAIGLVSLVIALTVAVVIGVTVAGGGMYWLLRSGKLPGPGSAVAQKTQESAGPAARHEITLEPLLVNLADSGGQAYLRLGMTLSVLDPVAGKGDKPKEEKAEKGKPAAGAHDAELQDAALAVIGRETTDELLAADGKERLKQALRAAIAARVPEMKVADLFFTEFLVQR